MVYSLDIVRFKYNQYIYIYIYKQLISERPHSPRPGVDAAQRTSKGRLAIDLARANGWVEARVPWDPRWFQFASRRKPLRQAAEILENPVKPVKVRDMFLGRGYIDLYIYIYI